MRICYIDAIVIKLVEIEKLIKFYNISHILVIIKTKVIIKNVC